MEGRRAGLHLERCTRCPSLEKPGGELNPPTPAESVDEQPSVGSPLPQLGLLTAVECLIARA